MKKVILFACLVSLVFMGCHSKKNTKFSISIEGYEKNTPVMVQIADGIDALTFWEPDTIFPNRKGEIDLKIPFNKPFFIAFQIQHSNGISESMPLYISKPGKYEISLSLKEPNSKLIYPTLQGKNEKGVSQLINFEEYTKIHNQNNTLFSSINSEDFLLVLNEKIEVERKPFTNLLKNHAIDDQYYQFATNYIQYYFAFHSLQYINEKIGRSDTSNIRIWKEVKNTIFKNYPLSNHHLYKTSVGKQMIDLYLSEIVQNNKMQYEEALKASLGQTFMLQKLKGILHPDVYKYYALQYLDGKAIRLDEETIPLFEAFAKEFPYTASSVLYKKIQLETIPAIKTFYATKVDSLQAEIRILDDLYALNSLREITQRFPGQFIFIDIWASWCPDCISEFKYNDVLKKYLKEKNIPIVYIAFERSPDREKWKLYLNRYQLTGNHVKCSDALKEDLYRILGTRSVWIPRYMLVNPWGEIVILDAPTPSSGNKLYDLINSKMNSVVVSQPVTN